MLTCWKCKNEKARKTYGPNECPVGSAPTYLMHDWMPSLLTISTHLCCWTMLNKMNYFHFYVHPWLILWVMTISLQQDLYTASIREEKRKCKFLWSGFTLLYFHFYSSTPVSLSKPGSHPHSVTLQCKHLELCFHIFQPLCATCPLAVAHSYIATMLPLLFTPPLSDVSTGN